MSAVTATRRGGHAAHRRFPWLRRTAKAARPAVAAVHGTTLKTDYIVTGGHALPVPDLVPRTGPVSVKTPTPAGGYDTRPFDVSQLAGLPLLPAGNGPADEHGGHQQVRVPGATVPRQVRPAEPLADVAKLARVRDGLLALLDPSVPSPRFPGSPSDGAVALEDGNEPVTLSAPVPAPAPGEHPAEPEPYTTIAIQAPDGSIRCGERLLGLPGYGGSGTDKDGQPYAGVLLGAGISEAAKPGECWSFDTTSPDALAALTIAAIEGIPHVAGEPAAYLERIIAAAQTALARATQGGPQVDGTQ